MIDFQREETGQVEQAHRHSLENKHSGLEAKIEAEVGRPGRDDLEIARLKKQKLRVKEALSKD